MKRQNIYFTDKVQEKIRIKSPNIKTEKENTSVEKSKDETKTIINKKIDLNKATINDLKKINLLDNTDIKKIAMILKREIIFSFEELNDLTNLNYTKLNSLKQHTYIDDSKPILEKKTT